MKHRDIYWRRYKIQETLYTENDTTVSFKVDTLGPHTIHWPLLIAFYTHSTFSGVLFCCRPSRAWVTFNRFPIIFGAFVLYLYLRCTHCIIPEILLNYPNSFCGGMFKLNAKFDAYLLFYSLSYFEYDGHRVHMFTQQCLPIPTSTSIVKLSLFMHAHSSPLSLAAKLHQCCTNHSRYINNGWTFSGQASYGSFSDPW